MVVMIGCQCDGLPAHDHLVGHAVVDGVYGPVYDDDDVGRVWVDWYEVAKALAKESR